MFILYIPLLYFWYMFQCHVHHHQGELLCHLLKTIYCYKAVKYGFCGSYTVNILWKVQLCVCCSYNSCTVVKNHRCGTTVLFILKNLDNLWLKSPYILNLCLVNGIIVLPDDGAHHTKMCRRNTFTDLKFKVCKSVHHRTIQINQPTRCNSFSSLLLDVYVQLNMFLASSHPSSGAQQLQ